MVKRARLSQPGLVQLVPGQEYRVMSVHSEWAWAILHAGKEIENRSWQTPYRGPLLIHASGHKSSAAELEWKRGLIAECSGLSLDEVPTVFLRSAILGSVELVECVDDARSPWAGDELHWILRAPHLLATPITEV